MKCPICKSKFEHPIKRGRNSRFCGPKCRAKHRKKWRRQHDAQEYVKALKCEREIARYHRKNPNAIRQKQRKKELGERLKKIRP